MYTARDRYLLAVIALCLLGGSVGGRAGELIVRGSSRSERVEPGRRDRELAVASAAAYGRIEVRASRKGGTVGRWHLEVTVDHAQLPAGARLWIRRTTDGEGEGRVEDGGTYQRCVAGTTVWFSGEGERRDIHFQYRVDGMSATTPAADYAATLIITLVEE